MLTAFYVKSVAICAPRSRKVAQVKERRKFIRVQNLHDETAELTQILRSFDFLFFPTGRTLNFDFDVSVTPIAGQKALSKSGPGDAATSFSEMFGELGKKNRDAESSHTGWKKPTLSQVCNCQSIFISC